MTTRRTFLRVLGSAIVGAVVAPALPLPAGGSTIAELNAAHFTHAADAGSLSYETLRSAYEACCLGREVPNLLITSSSVARRLGRVFDVDVDEAIEVAA